MLKIIYGDLSSDAYNVIKNSISELIDKKVRSFLIVPEQQAVVTEKELLRELKPSASLSFEVTNFTRLADTVYRKIGGLAGEYSTKAKEALVMWKTLTELAPFLDMTGGDCTILRDRFEITDEDREKAAVSGKTADTVTAGHVRKALSAVSELKGLSIEPKLLTLIADSDRLKDNSRLKAKLSDMANILAFYTSNLKESYTSVRDVCENLAQTLKDPNNKTAAFGTDTEFFVYGFTSFTDPQYKVLFELMKNYTVTVHIPMHEWQRKSFEFTEIANTDKKLREAKGITRVEAYKRIAERRDGRDQRLDKVTNLIWRNDVSGDDELKGLEEVISIFEAQDPYEECDFVAADIKRRIIASENTHYRDFAVIARNSDSYSGLIDTALKSAGIPYFISRKKDVSSYEAVKLIYAALGTVAGGFKREDVISYAKCNLAGIGTERCDEFELYTETWGITGVRFTDGIAWNMNPDGIDGGLSSESEKEKERISKKLIMLNETRAALIDPLTAFQSDVNAACTVEDYATALVRLLEKLSIEKKLYAKANELEESEPETADACQKLWGIICSALDDLVSILGKTKTDIDSFTNQLKVVFGEADIGRIPAFHDTVTVGSADMLRLTEKKHIYLIGVNAGEFPGAVNADAYFTEKEKQLLSKIEVEYKDDLKKAYSDNDEKTPYARELFFFSRALWIANRSVTLTYSTRNAALGRSAPSDAVTRILKLMNAGKTDEKELYKPRKIKSLPPIERIFFPRGALEDARGNEAVYKALENSDIKDEIHLTRDAIENSHPTLDPDTDMYGGKDIALSQSKIEDYIDCPFAYFLGRDLKLSRNEKVEFDARNVGTFLHSILENFFKDATLKLEELKKSDKETYADTDLNKYVSSLSEADRDAMVKAAAEAYLNSIDELIGAKRQKLLLDRLESAAHPVVAGILDELSDCKFVPAFFELPIAKNDDTLPDPVIIEDENGKTAFVHGNIDRVDVYRKDDKIYVRVIDYKTGAKNFKPSDIKEGKNLQMFLYLKSLVETKKEEFLRKLCDCRDEESGDATALSADVESADDRNATETVATDAGEVPPSDESDRQNAVTVGNKKFYIIPAGVIYTKTDLSNAKIASPSDEARDKAMASKQGRSGMVLDEKECIDGMNKNYIPIKYNKPKGKNPPELSADTKDNVYSYDKWAEMGETMVRKIGEIASRMRKGDISLPDEHGGKHCENCKFKVICRKN